MVRSVHALDVLEQLVGLVGGIVEVAGRGRRLGQLGPQLDRLCRDRVTRLEQIEQTPGGLMDPLLGGAAPRDASALGCPRLIPRPASSDPPRRPPPPRAPPAGQTEPRPGGLMAPLLGGAAHRASSALGCSCLTLRSASFDPPRRPAPRRPTPVGPRPVDPRPSP